jgi:hypothetical protein
LPTTLTSLKNWGSDDQFEVPNKSES